MRKLATAIDVRADGFAANAKVKVVTNFAGQLPPCSLDRDKIKQVFVNLFTNACHAMPNGGILTVTTSQRRASEQDAAGGPTGAAGVGARFRAGDTIGITYHVASILGSYGFSSPTYFPSPADVTRGNDAMLEICAAEPDRVRIAHEHLSAGQWKPQVN